MTADRVTSATPWHIVLVLDDSASMQNGPCQDVNEAVEGIVGELQLLSQGKKPYFKISVIAFGTRPTVLAEAQTEQDIPMDKVTRFTGASGSTDAAAALREAADVLSRNAGPATDFTPYVFFMSDGQPDDEGRATSAAELLKQLDLPAGKPRLVTIGVTGADEGFMRRIASNSELFIACDSKTVARLFPQIGTNVGGLSGGGTEAMDKMIVDAADEVTEV